MIAAVTLLELPDEQQPEVVAVGRSGRTAVIQLIFRTGAIRVLSLIGTTILARILLPEEFGTFAVVTLLINLVGPIADFGLGPALIQQKERPTQKQISTVFFLQVSIATALMVLVWLVSPFVAGLVSGSSLDLEAMIRVAALVLPMAAIRSLPGAMMARILRFGPLATIEVVQTLVYFTTAIVLALNGYGAWSFVWALVGNYLSGTILAHVAWHGRVTFEFDRVDARRIIKFGIPFQATGLLISSRDAMVPLFGGLAGGLAAIGYLNFGFRLGRLAGSVDEVIGRVAFPVFSRLQADADRLGRALTWTIETMALMLTFLLSWAIAVAPTLIPFVFTERWRPAVEVFQLVALATFALVPGNFVRGLAFATAQGRAMFNWSAATLILLAVLFPIFLIQFGVAGGGLAFLIYSIVQLVCYVWASRKTSDFPWLRLLRIYGLGTLAAAMSAVVNSAIGGWVGLVVSGFSFLVAFALLLLAFERDQLNRAWRLIRGDFSFRDPEPGQVTDDA
jgi:O-antigen/teichoic acid export membrane protein